MLGLKSVSRKHYFHPTQQYQDKLSLGERMADSPYLDDAFDAELRKMLQTFIEKNKDYGKGNILDTGEMGIIFRINDKINRLKNLQMSQKQPKNESIDDSWLDIAVYAIIAILLRSGKFKKLELNPKV